VIYSNRTHSSTGRDILEVIYPGFGEALSRRVESYLNSGYSVKRYYSISLSNLPDESDRLVELYGQQTEEPDGADGTIVRRCQNIDCNVNLSGTLETIRETCREHIKNQHSFNCGWRGCQCMATRQARCSTRADGHAAHITDIGKHYMSHFMLPKSAK
jgi:hypothetical protein